MVANRYLSSFKSCRIRLSDLRSLFPRSSSSLAFNEKYATSEPETNADRQSKIIIDNRAKITPPLMVDNQLDSAKNDSING